MSISESNARNAASGQKLACGKFALPVHATLTAIASVHGQ
jgi:hypothetical protein